MSEQSTETNKTETKKEELIPVFKLKQLDNTSVMCRYIGTIEKSQELYDEQMELSDQNGVPKSVIYDMGNYNNYNIICIGKICNIVGNYLAKHKKLPIYYLSMLYEKTFIKGFLFSIFLSFTIDNTTMKVLTSLNKYVNKPLTGKYTLELIADDDFLDKFITYKRNKLESDVMGKYIDQFESADDDDKNKLMEKIDTEINDILNTYKKLFEPIDVTVVSKKIILEKMKQMYMNPLISELIYFLLDLRNRERIEKSCPDANYEIPKKIINLKELSENMDTLDEKLDSLLDESDSSDSDDI